ncbi:M56 family metallopeptidase [Natronoflexus pectinivorans]|uniref:M56 family metallopeptidase n=1 Tax=Natronoflexus pectinivorans TaxID=682526 RepID=UPI0014051C7B|nr:M56 family metallopeptidase [Natronoflexus pectinivorans]
MYLISGILAAFIFPFINFSYKVLLTSLPVPNSLPPINSESSQITEAVIIDQAFHFNWTAYLAIIFTTGFAIFLFRILKQSYSLYKIIKRSEVVVKQEIKIVESEEFKTHFSFFTYVFVNPLVSGTSTTEILKHEKEHIRQMHWIDLILSELIILFQWFNPTAWIYGRFIRQNHEYLADTKAIQHSENPALYKATLINYLFGGEVIRLANSFNYSLNKKRFAMMTNKKTSTLRKSKILLIVPVVMFVFYAFAQPEHVFADSESIVVNENTDQSTNTISGIVYREDGTPLHGASVIIRGTSNGTVSNKDGVFNLSDVPTESQIVFSFVGLKSVITRPEFTETMKVVLININEPLENIVVVGYGHKSELDTAIKTTVHHKNDNEPLYILDGQVISKSEFNKLNHDNIEHISVYKIDEAIKIYGEKGQYGVIEITTKKTVTTDLENEDNSKEIFIVVEQMPEFLGGKDALMRFIATSIRYPISAQEKNMQGQVLVQFIVQKTGQITNATILKGVDPSLDSEALRVVQSMPEWNPGKQRNIPVDVAYTLSIDFILQ